jgi:uncharacterized protein YcbK (DUF882 family)
MVRDKLVIATALMGLGLVSAVASARREPFATAPADPPLERSDDDREIPNAGPALELAEAEQGVPFASLSGLRVVNVNSRNASVIRLYDERGRFDESAAVQLDELLADSRDPDNVKTKELDRRVYQLAYRAAYHFHAKVMQVISAYREPKRRDEGRHGAGRALDFRFPNVSAAALAAYLRQQPRVGVGVYTNPNTQFVHVDDRDRSYFWVDASPPGRHWRERQIGVPGAAKRDAAYAPKLDWPEGTCPSAVALALGPNPPPDADDASQ